jgi:hypothetical protein
MQEKAPEIFLAGHVRVVSVHGSGEQRVDGPGPVLQWFMAQRAGATKSFYSL